MQGPLWLQIIDGQSLESGHDADVAPTPVIPSDPMRVRRWLDEGLTELEIGRRLERFGVFDAYSRRWTPARIRELVSSTGGVRATSEADEA
jgi:hypothetical protein